VLFLELFFIEHAGHCKTEFWDARHEMRAGKKCLFFARRKSHHQFGFEID